MSSQVLPSNSNGIIKGSTPINANVAAELQSLSPTQQDELRAALNIVTALNRKEANSTLIELAVLIEQLATQASPTVVQKIKSSLNSHLTPVPKKSNLKGNFTTTHAPQATNLLPRPPNVTTLSPQSAGKKNQKNQKKLKNNKK